MSRLLLLVTSVLRAIDVCFGSAVAEYWHDHPDRWRSDDLFHFVTRPDLKPPRWNIVQHKHGRTGEGYLFVAPYGVLERIATSTAWVAHQMGPTIYEDSGELVWSGAPLYPERTTFDLKVAEVDGEDHLAFSVAWGALNGDSPGGARVILNSSYHIVANVTSPSSVEQDMHEFTPLDDGRLGVTIEHHRVYADQCVGKSSMWDGAVTANTVREFNMRTGETVWEWNGHEHIPLQESTRPLPEDEDKDFWDYTHMNSADRLDNGDYLLSARHTDTIYLISRQTGGVLWRLGGQRSSFRQLDDFEFSRQHDARMRSRNSTVTVISFFNNAGDEESATEAGRASSLMEVALYTAEEPMFAKVIRNIPRPDRRVSPARGNFQYLPNGNFIGGWSDNAYTTEHTPSGEVVYEASFQSSRFAVYRTYRLPWVGRPTEPPVSKVYASATRTGQLTTVMYVSWNGATEVAEWCFHSADHGVYDVRRLGCVARDGFETAFVAKGYHSITFAEAVDEDGESLGNSTLVTTELPLGWHDRSFNGNSVEEPRPVESLTAAKLSSGPFPLVISSTILILLYCCRHLLRDRRLRSMTRFMKRKSSKESVPDVVVHPMGVSNSLSVDKASHR